jgi:Na+-transporting NADH:ubiquinone oxidoreductase subunit NqrD
MERNEGGEMALVKTIGVLLLIGLALWIISVVVGFIASTVVTIFEFLIIAAVVGAVYHYFKHQKAHRT